jgi:prolactin regulatory element-binding protein
VQEKLQRNDMHFRSFEATFTPGHIAPLSRTMLFTPASTDAARREAYQRLMRLSPPQRSTGSTPNRRIGAIASALAGEENEVVIFSATTNRPQAQDVIQRISLKGQEANDIDIQDQGEGSFQVAYVLDHDVYVQDVNYDFGQRRNKTQQERRKVYTAPHAIDEKKARSKLRGVRWLSPKVGVLFGLTMTHWLTLYVLAPSVTVE